MNEIIKVLMERDGLSHEDAELQVSAFFSEMALALQTCLDIREHIKTLASIARITNKLFTCFFNLC
jgi:hypothetical protein